jgi:hypothetical protein
MGTFLCFRQFTFAVMLWFHMHILCPLPLTI